MGNDMRLAMATGAQRAHHLGASYQPGPARPAPVVEDRATLVRASLDAYLALEAAIAASAEALQRARNMSAQLDARLAEISRDQRSVDLASEGLGSLSPREREVLMLVGAGYTNKAIADALYLSPNTIKTHVSSLLTKLRAETRVQLAVIATQLGPTQSG